MTTETALPGMPEPPLTLAVAYQHPAGLAQKASPCWTNFFGDTHFEDAQSAIEAACTHLTPCERHDAHVEPGPCWTVQAVCGKYLDTADGHQVAHYAAPDVAVQDALAADWTIVDGVLRCEDGDSCEARR